MSAESNKKMMHDIFEAVGSGDRTAYYDALHDELVMHVMGSSSWSQTVRGKAKVLDVFFGYVSSRISKRNPTKPLRFLADGEWVMIEAKGDMVAVDGRPYQNDYCLHYRIAAGKIVEMKEYMDTALCEDRLGPFPAELKARLQAD
ncbi:MAG: nuclear transport factor 2 family protein [Bosea sp. (in: a-proteobacteria)]